MEEQLFEVNLLICFFLLEEEVVQVNVVLVMRKWLAIHQAAVEVEEAVEFLQHLVVVVVEVEAGRHLLLILQTVEEVEEEVVVLLYFVDQVNCDQE